MESEAFTAPTEVIQLVPGEVYQLGRKALIVEERGGELVLVLLAEAPRTP